MVQDMTALQTKQLIHTTLLSLPDDCLRYILETLYDSQDPVRKSALSGRWLESAAEANSLASTCRRLRTLFRTSISALTIRWNDEIGTSVVRLFAHGLRHLNVSFHMQASLLLHEVALGNIPLNSLRLSNCSVDAIVLERALQCIAKTLNVLVLSYVSPPGAAGLPISILASCANLEELTLHGFSDITDNQLTNVLLPTLRALSLGEIRPSSLTDNAMLAIPKCCPKLISLELVSVRWASPHAILEACRGLADSLRVLRLDRCSIPNDVLDCVVTECSEIVVLAVQDRIGTSISTGTAVNVTRALGNQLISLNLSGMRPLSNEHVFAILQLAPHLRELSLSNCPCVTDVALRAVGMELRSTIEILDLEKCGISDLGLIWLASSAPPKLGAIRLSSCRRNDVVDDTLTDGGLPELSVSGMEALLCKVGKGLRMFWFDSFPLAEIESVQSNRLTLERMARLLIEHCPQVETVSINGLRPRRIRRYEKARAELALMELEDVAPRCELFVDAFDCPPFPRLGLEAIGNY